MADPNTLQGWKRDLQQVYDSLMNGAEQFQAWFEETVELEAAIKDKTEELGQAVADIKEDRQQYREVLKQIPKVEDFSDEEIENRSGKASLLLDIASKIVEMEIHLPRKVEKLLFLLKHPTQ